MKYIKTSAWVQLINSDIWVCHVIKTFNALCTKDNKRRDFNYFYTATIEERDEKVEEVKLANAVLCINELTDPFLRQGELWWSRNQAGGWFLKNLIPHDRRTRYSVVFKVKDVNIYNYEERKFEGWQR